MLDRGLKLLQFPAAAVGFRFRGQQNSAGPAYGPKRQAHPEGEHYGQQDVQRTEYTSVSSRRISTYGNIASNWCIVAAVFPAVGIAVLAALSSATPSTGTEPVDYSLCSMPEAARAEVREVHSMSWFGAQTPRVQWCTDIDGIVDPRCEAQGRGQLPGTTPSRSAPSHPDATLTCDGSFCLRQALAPSLDGPGHGPGCTIYDALFRPPQS